MKVCSAHTGPRILQGRSKNGRFCTYSATSLDHYHHFAVQEAPREAPQEAPQESASEAVQEATSQANYLSKEPSL